MKIIFIIISLLVLGFLAFNISRTKTSKGLQPSTSKISFYLDMSEEDRQIVEAYQKGKRGEGTGPIPNGRVYAANLQGLKEFRTK